MKEQQNTLTEIYSLFEGNIRAGLLTLKSPATEVLSRLKYMELPAFSAPVELFEVEAQFTGAACFITFGESAVEPGLFFCLVELRRNNQEDLFLKDFLANRKDPRLDLMRFRSTEMSVETGVHRIVEVIVTVLNEELLPVLEGKTWVTAPFDWGPYK